MLYYAHRKNIVIVSNHNNNHFETQDDTISNYSVKILTRVPLGASHLHVITTSDALEKNANTFFCSKKISRVPLIITTVIVRYNRLVVIICMLIYSE